MGVTICIEHMDGFYDITCHNEYGSLRQRITCEQMRAIGLDYIIDEVEYMFYRELIKSTMAE